MSAFLHKSLPSINKWVVITFTGVLFTASYGLKEFLTRPVDDTNNLLITKPLLEGDDTTTKTIILSSSQQPDTQTTIPTPAAPAPTTTPSPEPEKPKEVVQDKYPIDQEYLKKVGNHSMAKKYTQYLVLAPKGSPIWNEKAKKLLALSDKSPDKRVWSYWYGYLNRNQLTPNNVHHICKWAASYSERTTLWTIGSSKRYFDFLWNICGREDKQKPNGWWYR